MLAAFFFRAVDSNLTLPAEVEETDLCLGRSAFSDELAVAFWKVLTKVTGGSFFLIMMGAMLPSMELLSPSLMDELLLCF